MVAMTTFRRIGLLAVAILSAILAGGCVAAGQAAEDGDLAPSGQAAPATEDLRSAHAALAASGFTCVAAIDVAIAMPSSTDLADLEAQAESATTPGWLRDAEGKNVAWHGTPQQAGAHLDGELLADDWLLLQDKDGVYAVQLIGIELPSRAIVWRWGDQLRPVPCES
jgi:hypothetical protein